MEANASHFAIASNDYVSYFCLRIFVHIFACVTRWVIAHGNWSRISFTYLEASSLSHPSICNEAENDSKIFLAFTFKYVGVIISRMLSAGLLKWYRAIDSRTRLWSVPRVFLTTNLPTISLPISIVVYGMQRLQSGCEQTRDALVKSILSPSHGTDSLNDTIVPSGISWLIGVYEICLNTFWLFGSIVMDASTTCLLPLGMGDFCDT